MAGDGGRQFVTRVGKVEMPRINPGWLYDIGMEYAACPATPRQTNHAGS